MAFNNNQGFPRPNQFQNQNFLQQQQLTNIRLAGNGNISPGNQNVFSTLQATGAAGGLPWGAGLAVQAGQHALQPRTMPAGFQNMANQQQQQNTANLMGMFANQQMLAQAAGNQQLLAQMAGNQQLLQQASGNQQLLAQAAGLMGNPGLGLQVPVGGAGILGAGPIGQMMPNMGLGNGGQFSPMGSNQMQKNRSCNNRSGSRDRKFDQFDKSRGDSKDNRDFRSNKNRREDNRSSKSSDRKDSRTNDRNADRKDRGDSKSRRTDRMLKDESKRSGGSGDRRGDRGGDKRRDERRDGGRRDDQRKTGKGDNRDNRNRDTGSRPRDQDSKSRRDRDRASPDRKRQRTQDDESDTTRRSRNEDPVTSETDGIEDWYEEPVPAWIRCSPSDLYFSRETKTGCLRATKRMKDLEDRFEYDLVLRADRIKESRPPVEIPERKKRPHLHCHHHRDKEGSSSSNSSCSGSDDSDDEGDDWMEELNRKKNHPYRLHEELWFNDPGEMNDGPLCRCSIKSRKTGIRHNIYPGEQAIEACDPESNNSDRLFHYRITMSPPTNFLTKCPSVIEYDNHEYIFEGFSLFSHSKLENVPLCRVIRFNIEYSIHIIEEELLQNFTVRSLDLFTRFLFTEILELVDLDWKGPGGPENCNRFHLMPRFSRSLPENGKEVLSMNEVMSYLLRSSKPLIKESALPNIQAYDATEWQGVVDEVRGMVVTHPGMKPCSLRIDQLDKSNMVEDEDGEISYPQIIHFGIRPAQLSYAGDPTYQKLWKQFVKFKHLLNSKPKILFVDKQKLQQKETALNELRLKNTMKREVTVEIDCKGFIRTGIKSDVTQHTMLIPVLLDHLRFHNALDKLETDMQYKFQDRSLLQLALTHTSFKVKYGTNTDHARNSLSNCGMRQLEYGDRKIHFQHTRKRGINILINIMSRLGNKDEVLSEIPHNERLEFLGDAVVEFISSVHLFFMFPWLEEGGLTSYRTALVQNQHLAILAKHLHLEEYMLYAHGPDLCHESDLKHAMANCFEALLGALFLDGGIEVADRIYGQTLFIDSDPLLQTWKELPLHPLQEDEPNGDRHWIKSSPALQKLVSFEESTGIQFDHIRLLARAFTLRSVGCNNLTLGHNQRLEFLGDTVLQLVASEYLFKHFPDHHEGHLSLLRSSLVNNRTQSIVSDDMGMSEHIIHAETRGETLDMKTKEKADLLEAFMGALYVDKGIHYCRVFCHVCFFPRLQDFIRNQVWNDPKSQLQQCCLTLRDLDGGEPDIPVYKMIESIGPTNTRRYKVAVYFKGERLATGTGHSIQQAEMNAAYNSLKERSELFPILAHQKRFLERKYKKFSNDQKSMKRGRLSDGDYPGISGLGNY